MRRLGNLLIASGVLMLVYAGLWQFGLAPGSRVTLPAPVALERTPLPTALPGRQRVVDAEPGEAEWVAPFSPAGRLRSRAPQPADQTPVAAPPPRAQVTPAPAPPPPTPAALPGGLAAPDAADRAAAAQREVPPGYAVRLAIPSIKLDTPVRQGGIVDDGHGNPIWETAPFVAVHYGDLTALVGARGNAVIAGHVVTLNEGNVFRFLYQLDLDDQIQVWDERGAEHDFVVREVKLVPPSDISVMQPTPEPTLTLITCGGTFDPIRREFSDRLIVVAHPPQ
jgi:LPXTG-site transpeptidase (sortase) family protein